MSISGDEFRAALGRFASGVSVVTTKDLEGKLHGLTVSAFSSVSMNPPLILICIQKSTPSYESFFESKAFAVNILSESQMHLSNHFASPIPDKFSGVKYQLSDNGLAVLEDCLANIECELRHSYDGGDHTIFVGEIAKTFVSDDKPLLYWQGDYQRIDR